MLRQITWAGYIYALILLVVSYYAVVIALFYYKKLKRIFTNLKIHSNSAPPAFNENVKEPGDEAEVEKEEALFSIAQTLIEKLKLAIDDASKRKVSKNELIKVVRNKAAEFKILKGTAYQVAINNFITIESQIHCSINLSEEDLRWVWPER
jgi:hypothetical protein